MSFEVILTDDFKREAKPLSKRFASFKADLDALIVHLETEPASGTSLGSGLYKLRLLITSKGKGKSGGARVINFVLVKHQKVFLLSVFDKNEKANLSLGELALLRKKVAALQL